MVSDIIPAPMVLLDAHSFMRVAFFLFFPPVGAIFYALNANFFQMFWLAQGGCIFIGLVNYLHISSGPIWFNHAHNIMYSRCLWLSMAPYVSVWVTVALLWPNNHLGCILVGSPEAKET